MVTVLIGVFSGILSGMGIGGGTILIPALSFFKHVGQQAAQGVNLLYFIPTALVSLWVHIKNKRVDFKVAAKIIVPGVFGAVCGALLAGVLEEKYLKMAFGVFLFFIGLYEIVKKDKKTEEK